MGSCCITQGAQPGALWQPRGVGWGGGWEGDSRGRGYLLYLWLIHIIVWQKPTQHCKAIYPPKKIIKKILSLKKDKEHFPFYCVFPEQGGFLTGPGFSLGETVCLQENEPICISALAKPPLQSLLVKGRRIAVVWPTCLPDSAAEDTLSSRQSPLLVIF